MTKKKSGNPFWDTVPFTSAALFFGGVFFTFATMGVVPDILRLGTLAPSLLALGVVSSGAFAVSYAYTAVRGRWFFFPVIFIAQGLFYTNFRHLAPFTSTRRLPATVGSAEVTARLLTDCVLIVGFIVIAYVLFILFFNREGGRYFKAHTEIALAKEIHQQLVPPIAHRLDGFEFHGVSVPSGEVGGDLVDIAEKDGKWLAYIADVSGHGVPSGVLMAMVKSATRMKPGLESGTSALLAEINKVIYDLKKSNMFVTAACLRMIDPGCLEYSLAGHLPILHYRAATDDVVEVSNSNVPLGMFEGMEFTSDTLPVGKGDVLLLITDGLAETADGKGVEFGIERLKIQLKTHAKAPGKQIVDGMMAMVQQHGKQDDDRSLLLLRKN